MQKIGAKLNYHKCFTNVNANRDLVKQLLVYVPREYKNEIPRSMKINCQHTMVNALLALLELERACFPFIYLIVKLLKKINECAFTNCLWGTFSLAISYVSWFNLHLSS